MQLETLLPTFKEVAHSLGVVLQPAIGSNEEETLAAGRALKDGGIRVLVARGPWLGVLARETDLPVFEYNPNSFDFLKAFTTARELGQRVGMVNSYDFSQDLSVFERALGIEILATANVVDASLIGYHVRQLHSAGAQVIVGGDIAVKEAELIGIPGVFLESGPGTIEATLSKAAAFLRGVQNEAKNTQMLRTILDNIDEGIVAFDLDGSVTAANKKSVRAAGLQEISRGARLADLPKPWFDGARLLKSEEGGETQTICKIKGKSLVVECIPIAVDDQVIGGIVVSREAEKVSKTEETIRRSLYGRRFKARYSFQDIVAASPKMKKLVELAGQYAKTELTTLIVGETGTGKELFAQGMHLASHRAKGPFVAVNCSALPETLLESELFGYDEGAFTGARKGGKLGLFEMAHGGTMFLDEISSMSVEVQARLLRVLEEKSVRRIGGDRDIHLDVRIIAACNPELRTQRVAGRFRDDLFYRLAVLVLEIPPLRDRKEDIIPLFERFVGKEHSAHSMLPPKIMSQLEEHGWPGNVRELENLAQRYVALLKIFRDPVKAAEKAIVAFGYQDLLSVSSTDKTAARPSGSIFGANSIPFLDIDEGPSSISVPLGKLDAMIGHLLKEIVVGHTGSLEMIADELGVSKSGLWKMLKRHGIKTDRRT